VGDKGSGVRDEDEDDGAWLLPDGNGGAGVNSSGGASVFAP
jgi:hypothetical protein